MARDVTDTEEVLRDDVVDRLRVHDIHYIGGGSAWAGRPSRYHKPEDAPAGSLVLDLAESRDARLQTALVGLLLRHPECGPTAVEAAREARDAATALLIRVSVTAAAALQHMWAFSLDLYLPHWTPIRADALARMLGVPSPAEDYGRAALDALDDLLQRDDPFPTNYRGAWEDVARHILHDLRDEDLSHVAS